MRRKRRATKRATIRRRGGLVVVQGVPATKSSPWTSPPEEILWATYLAGMAARPARWPHLKGLARQVKVGRYYLDFGRADIRRGIEVDGLAFHGGQAEWAADHARQRWLEGAGWRLTRYTAKEAAERPAGVLDEVNWLWSGRG